MSTFLLSDLALYSHMISAYDNFFCLYWASLPILPSTLGISKLGNYNSKNIKSNKSANPFRRAFNHIFEAHLAIKITPSSRSYCNLRWNSSSVNLSNNELANGFSGVSTKSNGSLASISHTLTLGPISTPALTFAVSSTNNELFKRFMKAYLRNQV